MKKITVILLLFVYVGKSIAQKDGTEKSEKKTHADYYWETMPSDSYGEILEGGIRNHRSLFVGKKVVDPAMDITTIKEAAWKEEAEMEEWQRIFSELQARYFREWGIVFWERFPDDDRRFEWLEQTISIAPAYVRNYKDRYMNEGSTPDSLFYDKAAYERWNRFYQRYRKEYQASNRVTAERKRAFERTELNLSITEWPNFYEGQRFDVIDWIDRAIRYAKALPHQDDPETGMLMDMFTFKVQGNQEAFGITEKDVDIIANKLMNSGIRAYEKVGLGFEKPMKYLLEKTPLRFNVKSTEGKSVELSEYKGKLVLVDFWNLGCGACISAMPKWREIYNKYNKYGFEIISACFIAGESNGKPIYKDEIASVKTVHQKYSSGSPLVLLYKEPGQNKHRFYEQYQFEGNPVYMLFDENGKPLMTNDALRRNPEAVIRNYLVKAGKIK